MLLWSYIQQSSQDTLSQQAISVNGHLDAPADTFSACAQKPFCCSRGNVTFVGDPRKTGDGVLAIQACSPCSAADVILTPKGGDLTGPFLPSDQLQGRSVAVRQLRAGFQAHW